MTSGNRRGEGRAFCTRWRSIAKRYNEEHESQAVAECLIDELRGQNLAVAGSAAALDALRRGNVDTLVMTQGYQPDPGWTCTACKAMGTDVPETPVCPQCAQASARPLDVKEALLRLAGQFECPVAVVAQADALMALGGVGCLLRARREALDSVVGERASSACPLFVRPVSPSRISKRCADEIRRLSTTPGLPRLRSARLRRGCV